MAFLAPGETLPSMSSPPQAPANPSSTPSSTPQDPASKWEYMTNRRSRKQASLFFLGATLFTLSTLITKRSLQYRRQISYPLFYKPSNTPLPPINLQLEGFKALQLATAQVLSGFVMLGGGLLWAFDISTIDDLRYKIRASVGQGGSRVKNDIDYQLEFDRWLAMQKKEKAERENAAADGLENQETGRRRDK